MTFQSNVGYSDFLYTIADNEYVYRDDSLSSTSSFIDSLTQTIQVVLLFYVPGSGLVTMLNIKADMSGTQDAKTQIEVDHYGIVDGQDLNTYIICQFIVISQIGFMLLDVFFAARKIVYALLRREYVPFQAFAEPCSDLFCAVFISVYIAFCVQTCSNSAHDVSDILGKLDQGDLKNLIAYMIQTIDRGFAKHTRSKKNFPSLKVELLSAVQTAAARRQAKHRPH